jgi:GGDEF domain-containing protein
MHEGLEGVLISNSMKYVGFLRAHALLKILNEKNLSVAQDMNPLSKLPGNNLIYEYVSLVLQDISNYYTLVYFDFDNFKAYNDTYGFRQGDRVILLFAELLKSRQNTGGYFVGHVGGDDFFMGIKGQTREAARTTVRRLAEKFRSNVESFYDNEDRARGYIEAKDRNGNHRRFPLITVSSAVLYLPENIHRIYSPEEIGKRIAYMKKEAKNAPDKIAEATLKHFEDEPVGDVIPICPDAEPEEISGRQSVSREH